MSEEIRGYSGGWKLEDALKEHAFSLELAYWVTDLFQKSQCNIIYDIGAGAGFYTAFMNRHIKYVHGFDAKIHTEISFISMYKMDISEPQDFNNRSHGTLCLEVGEHIEPEFESIVLDNIANSASKKIIMSWAIPGQGGFGHVNCQPNEYIIEEMVNRGWNHNPEQSQFLRERCSGCSWFENTLMVFDK